MRFTTRFLSGFMLAFLMQYGGQTALASEQAPIAFLCESSIGAVEIEKKPIVSFYSPTGYLEIILSPVERITFLDGELFSHTFFPHGEYAKPRAVILGENSMGFGIDKWKLAGIAWFNKHGSYEVRHIASIDDRDVRILYNKKRHEWDIIFL